MAYEGAREARRRGDLREVTEPPKNIRLNQLRQNGYEVSRDAAFGAGITVISSAVGPTTKITDELLTELQHIRGSRIKLDPLTVLLIGPDVEKESDKGLRVCLCGHSAGNHLTGRSHADSKCGVAECKCVGFYWDGVD